MNRAVAFILAVLYFVFSAGITLDLHYCMGKISAVNVEAFSENYKDVSCGVKQKKDCCKDELTVLKINAPHTAVAADYNLDAPVALLPVHNFSSSLFNEIFLKAPANVNESPPLSSSDILIKNCVFRI